MFEFGFDSSGGEDETVSVSGPTRLREVDCRRFEASGATTVDGDVRASSVDLDGSTSVGGDVVADHVESDGSLGVVGTLRADAARFLGSVRVDGDLQADSVETAGSGKFADLTADDLTIEGAFAADEVLADAVDVTGVVDVESVTADSVRISVTGESTVRRLVGDTVVVRREDAEGHLAAAEITGDDVDLARTHAETVTGEHVTVGPGCEVGVVRSPDPDVHPDASVGSVERSVRS